MFNSTLGVYIENGSAVQVYDVETSDTPGLVSLHTYPVGVVDHVLVLKGKDGLYKLSDAMHDDSLDGTYYNNFKLEDGVVTQNLRGKWIAVPSRAGDWQVKWYDGKYLPRNQRLRHLSGGSPTNRSALGSALIPQDYVPVDIVYKRLAS